MYPGMPPGLGNPDFPVSNAYKVVTVLFFLEILMIILPRIITIYITIYFFCDSPKDL